MELLVRPLFGLLLISVVFAFAFVEAAEADEIFVLKGGTVVRGYVMREEDDTLVIRLTGFAESGRVTIERSQVVERYVARDPNKRQPERQPDRVEVASTPTKAPVAELTPVELPESEPEPDDEDFLSRFVRLARVAIPDSPHALITLGILLVVVLIVLISWGAQLADLESPSLASTTILGFAFAACVAADIFYMDELLRADRAIWVVPLQVFGWMGLARLVLDGGFARVMLLFTFTTCSLLTVLFVTGAVFVTV